MKRFILIDHSISTIGGHHVEYARRVLEAAAQQGYQPLLAANKQLKDIGSFPCEAIPVYRQKFWTNSRDVRLLRVLQAAKENLQALRTRLVLRFGYSHFGVLWLNRHKLGDVLRQALAIGWREFLMLAVVYLAGAVIRFLQLLRQVIPFRSYLHNIWTAFVRFLKYLFTPLTLPFRLPRWLKLKLADQRKMNTFESDTRRLFYRIGIKPDDVIFIPTLGEAELMGLLRYIKVTPAAGDVSWHLLFRRPLFYGREPDYAGQEEDLRNSFRVFRAVQDLAYKESIHFYTDTEQLSHQYNRLGIQPFETLPVPVDDAYIQEKVVSDLPLNVVYAGDARREKGYHLLPRIVQDTWLTHGKVGKVHFEFQSNYNIEDGEPEAVIARSQLGSFPNGLVKLHTEPLSQDAFRELIQRADVILVPYESDPYFTRSSGIMVEAFTAGIPVVVPAGSWMALQLNPKITAHVHSVIENSVMRMAYLFETLPWVRLPKKQRWIAVQSEGEWSIPASGISSRIDLPATLSHLAIELNQDVRHAGVFLRVTVDQYNPAGQLIDRQPVIIGGEGGSAALIKLLEQCSTCWLTLSNAYHKVAPGFVDLTFTLLQMEKDSPLSAAGCIFTDEADISRKLVEVLDHRTHYLASASAFSSEIVAYHNPNQLVRQISVNADQVTSLQLPDVVGRRSRD